jgi:hypothetical protein
MPPLDHTPNDFFLWGQVKDTVYGQNPQSLPELHELNAASFAPITPQMPGLLTATSSTTFATVSMWKTNKKSPPFEHLVLFPHLEIQQSFCNK